MKLLLFGLAAFAVVAADFVVPKAEVKYGDKIFLAKQKFVFDVLKNIHEPFVLEEYVKEPLVYVVGESHYTNYAPVAEFFKLFEDGLLPSGSVFVLHNKYHLKEVVGLFNLFYYAKDWDTFHKNVLWARQHVNEAMFVYALTAAVVHREDTVGIVLPSPYEICPHFYFNSHVIHEAVKYKTQGLHRFEKDYVILANYTSDYYPMNEESKLAYLTEDIGWNAYYYYFHIDYPFWLGGEEFKLKHDRRGEQYLYMYQQLLARYFLERLSNGLGEIPPLSALRPLKSGYNPMLQYYNGVGFSVRNNYYEVYDTEDYYHINQLIDYLRRISDTIDYGVYTTRKGEKIDFRKPEAVEYLGNMIHGNLDSIDLDFFGSMPAYLPMIVGEGFHDYYHKYKFMTSALEHYQTAMRDPVFYQFYDKVVKFFYKFKKYLKPYTKEELTVPGVHIEDLTVGKLLTYFEYYDIDITSAVGASVPEKDQVHDEHGVPEYVVKAKQMRLNHKPFTVGLDVVSDKLQKVVIRLYMGPKYDQYGNVYKIDEARKHYVELDQFVYELQPGKNVIKRDSSDFYYSIEDHTTYVEYYKQFVAGIKGESKYVHKTSDLHCGFPDRLVLPRGSANGLPLVFYAVVTPYVPIHPPQFSNYDPYVSCGIGSGSRFVDTLPFGYPFDRPIDSYKQFYTPSMYFKDAVVYHKVMEF